MMEIDMWVFALIVVAFWLIGTWQGYHAHVCRKCKGEW